MSKHTIIYLVVTALTLLGVVVQKHRLSTKPQSSATHQPAQ